MAAHGKKYEKSLTKVDRKKRHTLDEAVELGRLKESDSVLLVAFGAGLTWGSAMLRW